jgi:hypothetical protein
MPSTPHQNEHQQDDSPTSPTKWPLVVMRYYDLQEPEPPIEHDVKDELDALRELLETGRRLVDIVSYKMFGAPGPYYRVELDDIRTDLPGERCSFAPSTVVQCADAIVIYGQWREADQSLGRAIKRAQSLGLSMLPLTDLDFFRRALTVHNDDAWWGPFRDEDEETLTPREALDRYFSRCNKGATKLDVEIPDEWMRSEVYIKVPYEIEQARKALVFLTGEIARLEKDEVPITPAAAQPASVTEDDLVTLDQAAAVVQQSKRTLERYVGNNRLPKPDLPGGGGRPHRWYWQNLKPALERHFRPNLPARFPSSRII